VDLETSRHELLPEAIRRTTDTRATTLARVSHESGRCPRPHRRRCREIANASCRMSDSDADGSGPTVAGDVTTP
jgi:hypothetical protein